MATPYGMVRAGKDAEGKSIFFPDRWKGEKNRRKFVAWPKISRRRTHRTCKKCGRPVRRSWRTGTLHMACFSCRYLMMIYGPNIEVRYVETESA